MNLMDIKILNTAMERALNRNMEPLNLTYAQASVIGYLAQNQKKDICQKDVEYTLGLTHPTISSILDRLKRKNLITTAPFDADHRYKKILLTQKSLALHQQIEESIEHLTQQIFNQVTPDDQKLFSRVISAMIKNLS